MVGPPTPSSGAAIATAQSLVGQEHQLNTIKIALLAHAENTEATDRPGVHSGGASGFSLCVPTGTLGGC